MLYNRLQQNFSKTIGVTTKGKISTFYYTKWQSTIDIQNSRGEKKTKSTLHSIVLFS